jgi:hypothetical protein
MNEQDPESPIEAQLAAPSPHIPDSARPVSKPKSTSEIIQNRWAVIGILFGVTGCLGIPLLWMNKQFTNTERIMWTVIVTLYTALLLYITYRICAWSYGIVFG